MEKLSRLKTWLAINIYHEARGECKEGMIAVAHVCLNRALKKHLTVEDVILQDYQFSWHNGNKFPAIEDYNAFIACIDVVQDFLLDRLSGNDLSGATHYFNPALVKPKWAAKMKFIASIGGHDFYRE